MTIILRWVIILIFFFSTIVVRGGAYASWQQKTIHGSAICNIKGPNGYEIGIKCREQLSVNGQKPIINNLTRWYLYKGFIIGEAIENDQIRFFIFDEAACQIQIIQAQEEFNAVLKERGLRPILWTRWYESNWGLIITDGHIVDKLDFVFFKLPILFVIGLITLIGLIKTKFNLRHRFNQVTLMIVGAIIVRIILDLFPNSL